MRFLVRITLFLALAGSVSVSSGAADTASGLVARSIAHHGGDLYEATRIVLDLCSKSGCSALEVRQDDGLYEYCATARLKAGERKVCIANNSVREWMGGVGLATGAVPSSPAALDRDAALRDWVMQRVYFAFLPYRLEDPSVRLQDQGLEEWDGRQLRRVKVVFESGTSTDADDEFLYWFDRSTARLEQFAYSYKRTDGGLRFRRLTNYRRVGGILFFDQENFGVEGPGLSVYLVSPAYVQGSMRHVSTVELKDIHVGPLD